MKPLPPFKIRDLNCEIQERLQALRPMQELVVVKAFKKGKCYGISLNDPEKDLILRNFARLLGGILRPKPASDLTTSVTLIDNTNTSRTLNISNAGSMTTGWHVFTRCYGYAPTSVHGSLLAFGNPASPPTPARTDYELVAKVAEIVPSSTTVDETNWQVIITGSYAWADGGTVTETGLYGYFAYGDSSWARFLLFHDAISPGVSVPAGGTVSVTYTIQL